MNRLFTIVVQSSPVFGRIKPLHFWCVAPPTMPHFLDVGVWPALGPEMCFLRGGHHAST